MGWAISGQPTRKYHWFRRACHEVSSVSSMLLITCAQQSNFHLLLSSLSYSLCLSNTFFFLHCGNLVHTSISDVTAGVALTCFVRIGEACGLHWEKRRGSSTGAHSSFLQVLLVYLVDLRPTNNPDGLNQVSKGGLWCQADSTVQVLTHKVGVIWNRAVRKLKVQYIEKNEWQRLE